jgi:hypothetical protein
VRPEGRQRLADNVEQHAHKKADGRIMPPRLRGGAWGHPGNVQARGLNPAQPSDQKYAAGLLKVPAGMY